MQQQIARYLENKITEKENTAQQSELFAVDSQLTVHGEPGETNVGSVDKCDDVKNPNEGKDPDSYFPNCSGSYGRFVNLGLAQRVHSKRGSCCGDPETLFSDDPQVKGFAGALRPGND